MIRKRLFNYVKTQNAGLFSCRIIFDFLLFLLLSICTVFGTGSIYTMQDFAIIFSLTQGGPGNATETFVLHVYKTAFNSAQIGMACAIGVTWLVFLLVFVVSYFKLININEKRMN